MPALADLDRAVKATIASSRLGVPVFVRLILQGQAGPDAAIARLAGLSTMAFAWLEQKPVRLHAVGSADTGQVCLTWQFEKGATASISYAQGPVRGDGLDVMVLGNHGAIYHDSGDADLWDEPLSVGEAIPKAEIKAAIVRALKSGQPETLAQLR